MSQPFKLYRLQQFDTQLDQARARLGRIEQILNDDKRLNEAQAQAAQSDRALQEALRALKRAEDDVQAQNIKIEQTEASLYGGKVRNPKELQDLQNESAALKRYLSVLEDRQLEQMMSVEEAEAVHERAAKNLEEVRSSLAVQHEALIAERNALLKDVERMENERAAAVSAIEPDDLRLYEQLRVQRRGVAVARISDGACSACGSTQTPSTLQAAHSSNQLIRCAFCGRILYAG